MKKNKCKYAFIIGSPRSGTTLLGDILDLHPEIARWYEPYFVLDYHFRNSSDDCRHSDDAADEVRKYIVNAFEYYRKKSGCQIVVDKSPRNSLKLPFLLKIFPEARFIHILRDGRDATLSINREWKKRSNILSGNKGKYLQVFKTVTDFLTRQPFLKHKIAALRFELGGFANLGGDQGFLHRLRWEGRIGWGPRFKGWQDIIDNISTLEFNALQWVNCVKPIIKEGACLDKERFMEIHYEKFLDDPKMELEKIFSFLEVEFPRDFMSRLPSLKENNFGKWKKAFSPQEKALIGPILNDLLIQLGYENSDSWYTG